MQFLSYGDVLPNVAEIPPLVVMVPHQGGWRFRIEDSAYEAHAKLFLATDGRKALSFMGYLNRRYGYEKFRKEEGG